MTGLYAASREVLAEALCYDAHDMRRHPCLVHREKADRLIDKGVVKVIDPDDDAQVRRIGRRAYELLDHEAQERVGANPDYARAVLRALVEEQP